ncbi:MAG: hypothetical protein U1A25_00885 [Candidatus Sungbacteria bacterium]|nr:hypothetical protein [bacterium]MDZ4260195.1 hypothetical protein [Candidatus Sungbacteria bacterium]
MSNFLVAKIERLLRWVRTWRTPREPFNHGRALENLAKARIKLAECMLEKADTPEEKSEAHGYLRDAKIAQACIPVTLARRSLMQGKL